MKAVSIKRHGFAIAAAAIAALAPTQAPAAAPEQERQLAQRDPFAALVGRRPDAAAPERAAEVDRYLVSADGRAFLLENRREDARIKFLCAADDPRLDCRIDAEAPAEEIFILTKTRGPRGDVLFRDGAGELRLRVASYGGATVFWPGEAGGAAASKSFGDDAPLALPAADFSAAARRAQGAAAHLSARAGAPILFDIAAGAADQDAAVLADAVARAASGMQQVAADATGARVLGARVARVRFLPGAAPRLKLNGTIFDVVYDPAGGLQGRPSSAAVARFLEENL